MMDLPESVQRGHAKEKEKISPNKVITSEVLASVAPSQIDSPNILVKLHNEAQVKIWLKGVIPSDRQPGGAISEGDCFFHSIADCLNQRSGKEEYSIQSLRIFCDEYVKDPKNSWVKDENVKDREDHNNYLVRIRFTAEELLAKERARIGLGLATWGRPKIEGRIFCEQYNVRIHVIQIQDDGALNRYLVDKNGETNDYNPAIDYLDINILHIINYHNHFVPLLNSSAYIPSSQKELIKEKQIKENSLTNNVTISGKKATVDQFTIGKNVTVGIVTTPKALNQLSKESIQSLLHFGLLGAKTTPTTQLISADEININRLNLERNITANLILDESTQRDYGTPTSGNLYSLFERLGEFYYKQHVKRVFDEPRESEDFDDLYTALALIREREVESYRINSRKELISVRQMNSDRIAREEHLHLYERMLYTERTPLDEKDLYLPVESDPENIRRKKQIQRILIRGQAGIGKTTFCYHLARKLIKENKWVFVIQLRYLRDITPPLTDAQVICKALSECFDDNDLGLLEQLVTNANNDKSQAVYWIVDGYDEIANLPESHPLQQWIKKAFKKDHFLITTRPRAVQDFNADRLIEMVGYLPEDANKYIYRYFSNKIEVGKKFEIFVKNQFQLGAINRIPIILELMCWIWKERFANNSHDNLSLSFTDMYSNIFTALCKRLLLRNNYSQDKLAMLTDDEIEMLVHQEGLISPLLELSYQSFIANQFILTGANAKSYMSDITSNDRFKILNEFGFIRCLKDCGSFERNEYSFIHLTFQEYLAARKWVQLFTSNDLKDVEKAVNLLTGKKESGFWINSHKYDKRYEIMWGFVAGLLKNNPFHLKRFVDLIHNNPRDKVGGRHIALLIQVIGEADCFEVNSREYNVISSWFSSAQRHIGFKEYAPILARYPKMISMLEVVFERVWNEDREGGSFIISLLSAGVNITFKERIFQNLINELKQTNDICSDLVMSSVPSALDEMNLTNDETKLVIPLLLDCLQKTDEDLLWDSVELLEKIYKKNPTLFNSKELDLFDHLFLVIKNKKGKSVLRTLQALGNLKLLDEKRNLVIDMILSKLEDENYETRRWVTEGLAFIPIPKDRQLMISQLFLAILNNEKQVGDRTYAAKTLATLEMPEEQLIVTIDVILELLPQRNSGIDYLVLAAGFAYIKIPEYYLAKVFDTLIRYINTWDAGIIINCCVTLEKINIPDNYHDKILNSMLKCLSHPDDRVKDFAGNVLENMYIPEERREEFIRAFLQCLKTSHNSREQGAKNLGLIEIPEKLKQLVIKELMHIIKNTDEDDAVASVAITSLSQIGIPQAVGREITSLPVDKKYGTITHQRLNAFNRLNSNCLILDDESPVMLPRIDFGVRRRR